MGVTHTCHARACKAPVPPAMLMCKRHWFLVPLELRDVVWATYRRGQEIDKRPSREYLDAADAAIKAVAEKEGIVTCTYCSKEHDQKLACPEYVLRAQQRRSAR